MKYDELISKALELLENDDNLFVECVNELDNYNGFADGFRCFDMWELNDICYNMKATELLENLTSDFNVDDNYFYWSIYGLESTSDVSELYHNNANTDELLNNVIDNWNNIYICENEEFQEVMNSIVNGDFE